MVASSASTVKLVEQSRASVEREANERLTMILPSRRSYAWRRAEAFEHVVVSTRSDCDWPEASGLDSVWLATIAARRPLALDASARSLTPFWPRSRIVALYGFRATAECPTLH